MRVPGLIFLFWFGFKVEFKEGKEGKRKQNPTRKISMKIPANTEEDNGSKFLSENEAKDHHRDEFPGKEIKWKKLRKDQTSIFLLVNPRNLHNVHLI